MKQLLAQPSNRALVWATRGGFSTLQTLMATLVCFASPPIAYAQTNRQLPRNVQQTQPADAVHFAKSSDCALCHSFSDSASAMRDGKNRNVAPFDLWSGSMMANSAVDPYWKAAVSAEVAATPSRNRILRRSVADATRPWRPQSNQVPTAKCLPSYAMTMRKLLSARMESRALFVIKSVVKISAPTHRLRADSIQQQERDLWPACGPSHDAYATPCWFYAHQSGPHLKLRHVRHMPYGHYREF